MRRLTHALTACAIAATLTAAAATPAHAAIPQPEPTPTTDLSVSAGFFIYLRLDRGDVQGFPDTVLSAGSGAVAAYLCPKIPNAVGKVACGAIASAYIGSVIGTIRDAKKANQCVELRYNYAPGLLVGWRRYGC